MTRQEKAAAITSQSVQSSSERLERTRRDAFEAAVVLAADQRLTALPLSLLVGFPLLLGWMHEARFFG